MKYKATSLNLSEILGREMKTIPIHYDNPVKELYEYGEAVERGRKILVKMGKI